MAAHLRLARVRGAADGEGLLGAGRGRRWPGRSRGGERWSQDFGQFAKLNPDRLEGGLWAR